MTGDLFDPMLADPAEVLEHGLQAIRDAEHRWPDRLRELYDVELAVSRRLGLSDEDAARDAAARAFAIASYLGGRLIYLPGPEKLRLAIRDAHIFRLQGKLPVDELARRFQLTETQIYHILRTETERVRDRLQGRLFD